MVYDFLEDARDALFGNERQTDMSELADRNGFDFKKRISIDRFDFELRSFPLFKKDKHRRISNVLSRKEEAVKGLARILDCYKEGKMGKKATTAVLIKSDLFDLAEFLIRPKRRTEKFSSFFFQNTKGLNLPSDFDKWYTLETKDPETVYYYLTDRFVGFLQARPGLWLKGKGEYLMIYEKGKMKEPMEAILLFERAIKIGQTLLFDKSNELV